ncbi:MAG TPA: hypothetical protein ENN77_02495, partial [Candidatus Wirthbacteria bacterium]|nr:hypothetical protein [Candidatus Wirthbacteria bacterium]
MRINPEFKRNIWLEISKLRLIIGPVILGLILWLSYLNASSSYETIGYWGYRSSIWSKPDRVSYIAEEVGKTALWLFGLITIFWGTILASGSVSSEVQDETWDNQKMSYLGAWEMVWGKLFGRTIYSWYLGAVCMLIYGWSSLLIADRQLAFLKRGAIFILIALLAQAVGFMLSLLGILREQHAKQRESVMYALIALFAGMPFLQQTFENRLPIKWYGMDIHVFRFLFVVLLVFLGWALLGCYRQMREELHAESSPWGALAFGVFCMFFFPGFLQGISGAPVFVNNFSNNIALINSAVPGVSIWLLHDRLRLALAISFGMTYLSILLSSKDLVGFRKLFKLLSADQIKEVLVNLPVWIYSLALNGLLVIL